MKLKIVMMTLFCLFIIWASSGEKLIPFLAGGIGILLGAIILLGVKR